jgi:hypothetical protein
VFLEHSLRLPTFPLSLSIPRKSLDRNTISFIHSLTSPPSTMYSLRYVPNKSHKYFISASLKFLVLGKLCHLSTHPLQQTAQLWAPTSMACLTYGVWKPSLCGFIFNLLTNLVSIIFPKLFLDFSSCARCSGLNLFLYLPSLVNNIKIVV